MYYKNSQGRNQNSQGRNPSNFSVHFLKIDDFINSFWLNLTFSNFKSAKKFMYWVILKNEETIQGGDTNQVNTV